MIKKLLLMSSAVFALSFGAVAQHQQADLQAYPISKRQFAAENMNSQAKITSSTITDTLWYFFNKHYYRNTAANSLSFLTIPSVKTSTNTAQQVTQCGAVFLNTATGTVAVSGAEGIAIRRAGSTSPTVTIKFYLANVVGGVPITPYIDSTTAGVSTSTAGTYVGANFPIPHIVTGPYAILFKNGSALTTDTVRLFLNNASTAASTVSAEQKFGEGLGVLRYGGSYSLTTGFYNSATTDYEFLVAPRVAYTASVGVITPTTTPLCLFSSYSFTNTSSPLYGHRQYNLNEFAVEWAPFANSSASVNIQPDPVYVWNFGDASAAISTNGTVTAVNKAYTTAGTFNGTLTVNQQRMSDYDNHKTTDNTTFSKTSAACGPVGIKTVAGFESFNVYPNPAVSGKTNLTGLVGSNTILVYNMLGQAVSSLTTDKETITLDLSSQPAGNYFVRVVNSSNATKTVKIINQ